MNTLEEENTLSSSLKSLKKNLEARKRNLFIEDTNDVNSLIGQFATTKSYKILEQSLNLSAEKPEVLLKYSDVGITLFPAQPFVYLTKAKALNYQKNHKNALATLQNGIDFVIEDEMEVKFYNEFVNAYKGLGNKEQENKYQQKANKLKS
jgi:predicted Zn-dependent protease